MLDIYKRKDVLPCLLGNDKRRLGKHFQKTSIHKYNSIV